MRNDILLKLETIKFLFNLKSERMIQLIPDDSTYFNLTYDWDKEAEFSKKISYALIPISKILMVDVQNDEIHIYLPDKMRVDIKIKQKNGKKVGFKPEEMENEI